MIERRLYSEHPPRYEYYLTEAGRELFPVMLALRQWGDKWAVDAPVLTHRHSCGQPVQVDLVCRHCGRLVTHDTIHAELTGSWPGGRQGVAEAHGAAPGCHRRPFVTSLRLSQRPDIHVRECLPRLPVSADHRR